MAVEISAGTVEVVSHAGKADAKSRDYSIGVKTGLVGGNPYTGEYTVVPTTHPQTLQTEGRILAHNITVGAIPSNYGLITYNGSVLTVS